MNANERIYLDNAATSWPKPEEVYQAADAYQRSMGCSIGRGTYSASVQARSLIEDARQLLRQFLQAPPDSELVFAYSGTDALNLCLHGFLTDRCHVVTSEVEHNSVLRPLRDLSDRYGLGISYASCDDRGRVTVDAIRAQLRADTRLVVLSHVSNVTGLIQPIEEIGELLRSRGVPLLVDAAQSVGHIPIDLSRSPIDLLAASGHKGLLGPLGTGVVYMAPGMSDRVASFRQGGTGSQSEDDRQPVRGADKYEAGNLPAPGIAGLAAGVRFLLDQGADMVRHERLLTRRLLEQLMQFPGVRVLGDMDPHVRIGLVSFTMDGLDCHEIAQLLDVVGKVEVRAGLMCAPRIHQRLGSADGSVRVSFGPFNTLQHVDTFGESLSHICANTG